jgi:recombinase
VVKEFVDRGESARSANRPEPQKMLRYLKDAGDVDYVIVHKLDRLARNRANDVKINRAFDEASVRLISTSENIDQSPGGILLHGIMSSIDEFYSRNLANGVIKGMGEKARNGETLRKAPLGYRNWTAGWCFSDIACFVFQAVLVRPRNSRSASLGTRYPRIE